jgi:hypothetical protein
MPSTYPTIAELDNALLSGRPPARFAWYVHVMLSGLVTTPVPMSGARDLPEVH